MTGAAGVPGVLAGEPWELLHEWLPPNNDLDRPQMTLSTVTPDGHPDARTVLLTEFTASGFYFHTDSRSRKAVQLAANPAAALTFLWPGFTRQLVVLGTAQIAHDDEIAAAYQARSPHLQQLAWQNTHEFAQLPAAERVQRWLAFTQEHAEGFTQPATWTGYLLRPHRLTFWHGSTETASLRKEFTLDPGGWTPTHLPG